MSDRVPALFDHLIEAIEASSRASFALSLALRAQGENRFTEMAAKLSELETDTAFRLRQLKGVVCDVSQLKADG